MNAKMWCVFFNIACFIPFWNIYSILHTPISIQYTCTVHADRYFNNRPIIN